MPKKTGPKTETGKHISSQNAATHYMTSRKMLVKGEDPAALEALLVAWHDKYPSNERTFIDVVSNAGASAWLLLRAQRGYDKTIAELYLQPENEWSDEAHAKFQRSHRYLTAAKRTLDRDQNMILQLLREQRAQARAARIELAFQRNESEIEAENKPVQSQLERIDAELAVSVPSPMFQHIYVSIVDGKTITDIYPSNQTMLQRFDRLSPVPSIRRQMHFQNQVVPPEYEYVGDLGPNEIFAMTLNPVEFRAFVERETDGHAKYWPDTD